MKARYNFRGQMPILFTTLDTAGNVDVAGQQRLIDLVIQSRPAAIGHLGGASEYHKLSQKDRDLLVATLVERVAGRYPVFVGNTCLSLKQSIENARRAETLGADLIMTCSPIYGPVPGPQLYDYYQALCDEVDLPIIVQDTGASASVYTPEFIAKLSELPNIGYAKCEGANFLTYTRQLMELAGDRLQIIGGAGGVGMIQLLRLGVTAFMTGTEAPEIHSAVIRTYLNGETELAEEMFNNCILPYLDLMSLKLRTTALSHLMHRGISATSKPQWPNAEGELDSYIENEFERVMSDCYKRLDIFMNKQNEKGKACDE